MKIYEYPLIDDSATPERKIQQMKDYLYKLTDELNYNASLTSAANVFNEAADVMKMPSAVFESIGTREARELLQAVVSFVELVTSNDKTALAKRIITLEREIRMLKGE